MEPSQSNQNLHSRETPDHMPQENPQSCPPGPLDEARRRIEELEGQLKEKDNKYVYLYAEFENFKKRTLKERLDAMRFGWESVARELLQVVDNLERAVAHMPSNADKNLNQGIQMVLSQFKSALQSQGVQQIESLMKVFDPNLHEAVGQEESEHPVGTILKEHVSGYTLHGRLLRPSKVTISSGKPAPDQKEK